MKRWIRDVLKKCLGKCYIFKNHEETGKEWGVISCQVKAKKKATAAKSQEKAFL